RGRRWPCRRGPRCVPGRSRHSAAPTLAWETRARTGREPVPIRRSPARSLGTALDDLVPRAEGDDYRPRRAAAAGAVRREIEAADPQGLDLRERLMARAQAEAKADANERWFLSRCPCRREARTRSRCGDRLLRSGGAVSTVWQRREQVGQVGLVVLPP